MLLCGNSGNVMERLKVGHEMFSLRHVVMIWLLAAGPAVAQDVRGSEIYAALERCRGVAPDAERLACFDRAAAVLAAAVNDKQVTVVDREEVRAAKRSLFGIALPELRLFNRGDDEPVRQIESTIRSVGQTGHGRYSFGLAEGGTWRMLETGGPPAPEPGDKVVIRRAALGSFLAKIGGARAVRVERVN